MPGALRHLAADQRVAPRVRRRAAVLGGLHGGAHPVEGRGEVHAEVRAVAPRLERPSAAGRRGRRRSGPAPPPRGRAAPRRAGRRTPRAPGRRGRGGRSGRRTCRPRPRRRARRGRAGPAGARRGPRRRSPRPTALWASTITRNSSLAARKARWNSSSCSRNVEVARDHRRRVGVHAEVPRGVDAEAERSRAGPPPARAGAPTHGPDPRRGQGADPLVEGTRRQRTPAFSRSCGTPGR